MHGKTGWSQIDVLQAGATGCTDMGEISDLRLRLPIQLKSQYLEALLRSGKSSWCLPPIMFKQQIPASMWSHVQKPNSPGNRQLETRRALSWLICSVLFSNVHSLKFLLKYSEYSGSWKCFGFRPDVLRPLKSKKQYQSTPYTLPRLAILILY